MSTKLYLSASLEPITKVEEKTERKINDIITFKN